jgi:hypothetical protein
VTQCQQPTLPRRTIRGLPRSGRFRPQQCRP